MSEYMLKSDIKQEIGTLIKIKPELHDSWKKLHDAVFSDGALSKKEKELIAIAGAHVTRCAYCIRARVNSSKRAGASDEEVVEAIYVGMRFAMGAPYAYSSIAFETVNKLEAEESITEGNFFSKNISTEIGEFREAIGPIAGPFMDFHGKVFEDGALSKRMKRAVIGLAMAHLTRCPWCIRGCAKDAKDFGLTKAQMAEAISVGMIMAAGACYAHTGVAMEALNTFNSRNATEASGSESGGPKDVEAATQHNLKDNVNDIECGC